MSACWAGVMGYNPLKDAFVMKCMATACFKTVITININWVHTDCAIMCRCGIHFDLVGNFVDDKKAEKNSNSCNEYFFIDSDFSVCEELFKFFNITMSDHLDYLCLK